MDQLIKALITEEQCIKLEKKFGIELSGEEEEEKSQRQIFEEIIRHYVKQQLLAAQAHAALEECQSPRKRIIRAESIKAAKRNKLL